jgi:hypothetical protein
MVRVNEGGVHQPDKARTGAEKNSRNCWPTISCGRSPSPKPIVVSENEVPTTLKDRVDPWTTVPAVTELAYPSMARQNSSLQESFSAIACTFSMEQMKLAGFPLRKPGAPPSRSMEYMELHRKYSTNYIYKLLYQWNTWNYTETSTELNPQR